MLRHSGAALAEEQRLQRAVGTAPLESGPSGAGLAWLGLRLGLRLGLGLGLGLGPGPKLGREKG